MITWLSQNYLTRGFWGDEAWTSLISQLPYFQMLKTTALDFHPPAYYSIIEFVYKFLPPTEIITRIISIFFFFLTGIFVYKIGSLISKTSFAVLASIVALSNPIFFRYAFEARNYTMFAFAAAGSIYFLIKLTRKIQVSDEIGFVFFSALGIYTHYYMFFILAAQGLFVLLFERKIFFRMVVLYLLVAILYLPWLPFLLKQVSSVGQSYWIGAIGPRTHYEALLRILGGEDANIWRTGLFTITAFLLIVGFSRLILKMEKLIVLMWFWAIIPFILASVPGLKLDGFKFPFRPIFFWRYLIGSAVPFSFLIVYSTEKMRSLIRSGVLSLVLLLCLVIDFLTFVNPAYSFREEFAKNMIWRINKNDKIVTVLPSFAEVLYYKRQYHLDNELVVLNEGLVQFSGKSLLDSYAKNKAVKIENIAGGGYFEALPGPKISYVK